MGSDGPTVKVEGMAAMRRALKAAGADLSELNEVHRHAAEIVRAAAAKMAPRRTENLANNIRTGATRRAGIVRAGGAKVPYANPIHWGWPARNIRSQPFMTDAAAATEPLWVDLYWAELGRTLDRIAREATGHGQ